MPQTFVINLLYDMHIQHGDSSHTRGISAAWPTEDSKFKAVILDTAGTNQPVNQSHCDDRQCVDREIRQRQVIDNFVVDIADAASAATLYVLNRMTTTDAVRDGGAAACTPRQLTTLRVLLCRRGSTTSSTTTCTAGVQWWNPAPMR